MSETKKIGEPLLKGTPYGIEVQGVEVVMRIANGTCRMDYNMALTLAAMLRNGGRIAKRNAGDMSKRFIGFADLTDGNLDEMKAQKSRDGTAIFVRGT